MSDAPKNPERDAALRDLAGRFSIVAGGQPIGISVGAAALFVVAQVEIAGDAAFAKAAAQKLRQTAALLDPRAEPGACAECGHYADGSEGHCKNCGVVFGS